MSTDAVKNVDADVKPAVVKAEATKPAETEAAPSRKSTVQLAKEVISGDWGVADTTRRNRLAKAGYNATTVLEEVRRQSDPNTKYKSIDAMADEVIAGKWGKNAELRSRLIMAGYSPNVIQAEVARRGTNGPSK